MGRRIEDWEERRILISESHKTGTGTGTGTWDKDRDGYWDRD
jgi:hypothetical protein